MRSRKYAMTHVLAPSAAVVLVMPPVSTPNDTGGGTQATESPISPASMAQQHAGFAVRALAGFSVRLHAAIPLTQLVRWLGPKARKKKRKIEVDASST